MTLSARNPEDVVNLALVRIGYPMRVDNMMEGTKHAMAALSIYAQTRDEVLRQSDWGFAERDIVLTLQKSAPVGGYIPPAVWDPTTNPPLPWAFQYAYPNDCLKVRAVKKTPVLYPDFDPQPVLYGIANDKNATPPVKVVLANISDAIMVYTGQVVNPLDWEADFIEAVAAALARRLTVALGDKSLLRLEAQDEAVSTAIATKEQG